VEASNRAEGGAVVTLKLPMVEAVAAALPTPSTGEEAY